MTKFSDQLFTDLMHEHSATLQATQLPGAAPGRSAMKRGAWLAGGAAPLAVGITAALVATSGGGAAAYAVTPHAHGTVTVGLSLPSGPAPSRAPEPAGLPIPGGKATGTRPGGARGAFTIPGGGSSGPQGTKGAGQKGLSTSAG